MGGIARAKAHSRAQLRKWGKEGGRPPVLDQAAFTRLGKLLAEGRTRRSVPLSWGFLCEPSGDSLPE